MRTIDRLDRLEARLATDTGSALAFWTTVSAYAAGFTDDAEQLLADDLLQMKTAEHLAWSLRFDPTHTAFAEIMALRGDAVPPFYTDGDEHL